MNEGSGIICQRCGRTGARVAYGWALLCPTCIQEDLKEYNDD